MSIINCYLSIILYFCPTNLKKSYVRRKQTSVPYLTTYSFSSRTKRPHSGNDTFYLPYSTSQICPYNDANRGHHALLPAVSFYFAAFSRQLYRQTPKTLLASIRNGIHYLRSYFFINGKQLYLYLAFSSANRGRLFGISPRIVAGSLFSFRRKTLFCPSYLSIRRQFRYSFRPPIGYIIGFQQESSRWTANRRSSPRAIDMVLLIFYFCNAYPYIDRQMAQYTAKTTEEKG